MKRSYGHSVTQYYSYTIVFFIGAFLES